MNKISCVIEREDGRLFLRIDTQAIGPEEVKTLAIENDSSEFRVLAAMAETSGEDRSVGRALEELLDWAFQQGRVIERELLRERIGL